MVLHKSSATLTSTRAHAAYLRSANLTDSSWVNHRERSDAGQRETPVIISSSTYHGGKPGRPLRHPRGCGANELHNKPAHTVPFFVSARQHPEKKRKKGKPGLPFAGARGGGLPPPSGVGEPVPGLAPPNALHRALVLPVLVGAYQSGTAFSGRWLALAKGQRSGVCVCVCVCVFI